MSVGSNIEIGKHIDVRILANTIYLKVAVFRHDVSTECFVVFQNTAIAKPLNVGQWFSFDVACKVSCLARPVVHKRGLTWRETWTN